MYRTTIKNSWELSQSDIANFIRINKSPDELYDKSFIDYKIPDQMIEIDITEAWEIPYKNCPLIVDLPNGEQAEVLLNQVRQYMDGDRIIMVYSVILDRYL